MNLWTPDLKGTGAKPGKGTDPICVGWYIQDPTTGMVDFGADIRFGPGMTRGAGVYRLTLPLEGISNVDPVGFTMFGGAEVGYGLQHKICGLNFCGVEGYESTDHCVLVAEDSMFVSHSIPAPNSRIDNIHYWGRYLADLP